MRKKNTLSAVVALGLLTLAAGCAAGRNTAEGAGNLVTDSAESAGGFARDRSITFSVKTAFIDDELVEAEEVDVDTSHGVVTLTGTQPSEAARQRAYELAWKAEGVHTVINNLVVR